jgi:hypothetical protein
LRRRHDAADRVDRKLLHHAVDGSGEKLQPGPLLGLDQVLGKPVRLLLGLGELVGERVPIFGDRLAARLAYRGHGSLRFVQMALLDAELLLLLDQLLEGLEIGELRAYLPVHKRLAHVHSRLDDRDQRLELMDRGRDRGLLGFLLRLLAGECGDLGEVLGHFIEQKLTLGVDQCRSRPRQVGKTAAGIVSGDERRCSKPRDIELFGEEIIVQVMRSAAFVVGSSSMRMRRLSLSASVLPAEWRCTTPVSNGWHDRCAARSERFSGRR